MRLIDAFKIALIMIWAGLVFSLPIAIGWVVPMAHRRKIFYLPWLIWSRGACFICRIDLRVKGRENIKQGFHRGRLFICNHQSALDIPLLVSIFPLPFLTKRENLLIPFIGLAGMLAGSIAFNRDSSGERRRVLEKIVDRAARHTSLYIFPEGTRSKDGELQQKVFPALLRMAWRAGINVVPIALHGSYMVVGHKAPGTHYPIVVEVGTEIEAKEFATDRAFADHCWQKVIAQHNAIRGEIAPVPLHRENKVLSAESQI